MNTDEDLLPLPSRDYRCDVKLVRVTTGVTQNTDRGFVRLTFRIIGSDFHVWDFMVMSMPALWKVERNARALATKTQYAELEEHCKRGIDEHHLAEHFADMIGRRATADLRLREGYWTIHTIHPDKRRVWNGHSSRRPAMGRN